MVKQPARQIIEQYITIADLAARLHISAERARQMVMGEPGVLKIQADKPTAKTNRPRMMYRIPESVAERIVRRSSVPAA